MIYLILGWIALLIIIFLNINYTGNILYMIPISLFAFNLGISYKEMMK